MPIVRNCLAACAVLVCFTAQAQVLRCTDARTGQVTYTDGTCPGAASVREVEPRKTPQEIQLERQRRVPGRRGRSRPAGRRHRRA